MLKHDLNISYLLFPGLLNDIIKFNMEISSKGEINEVYDSILNNSLKLLTSY